METTRQPFQDTIDTAVFYGGGARRDIVDEIKAAFADGVHLLTLTGTDGSGKTMICRVVEEEMQADSEILFFEQGVESFDEVVNRIAAQVELEETDFPDRNTRLEKAVEILNEQDRRLILILDGAEKIFLATLERIRRMLDQVNSSRLAIQLLISGRPLFSLNFKQLAIINFKVIEEQHFSLDPLDGRATHLYLNHCLDQSDTEEQKRFSLSQAEEIADIARGNFKLINQLAGKLLDLKRLAGEKDEEFEDYDEDLTGEPSRLAGLATVDLDFLKVPEIGARWYAAGAGIVVLILLIALLRGGDEDDTAETLPGADDVPELTLEKVEPDPIEIPSPSRPVEPLPSSLPDAAEDEPQAEVAESRPPEAATQGPRSEVAESGPAAPAVDEPQAEVAESRPPEAATQGPRSEVAESGPAAPAVNEPRPEVAESRPPDSAPEAPRSDVAESRPPDTAPEPVEQDAADDVQEEIALEPEAEDDRLVAGQSSPPESRPESGEEPIEPRGRGVEAASSVEAMETAVETEQPAEESGGERIVAGDEPVIERVEEPPAQPLEESMDMQQAPAAVAGADGREETGQTASEEGSAPVQQLTVLPKKVPSAEPAPTVVTLTEESKTRPDPSADPVETAPPPSREAESADTDFQAPAAAEEEIVSPEPRSERVASIDRSAAPAADPLTSMPSINDSSVYYAQRLAAGSRWLVGGSREKYTVQLMVLSSEEAQQNVRYMLSEENYKPIMDQLYILRKISQPQTVMLYWGEFDTPAEAREARGRLPSFLSRLEPFEIPVKDAVAKARAGQ